MKALSSIKGCPPALCTARFC